MWGTFRILAFAAIPAILPCIMACALGGPSEGHDANEPAAQQSSLPLPNGWLVDYIAQLQAPAELQVPIGERWRFTNSAPVLRNLRVAVWGRYVFLSRITLDPEVDFDKWVESRKAGSTEPLKTLQTMECRDIGSGAVLWSIPGVFGRITVLPGYLLVYSSRAEGPEIIVLEPKQGKIVRRIPSPHIFDPDEPARLRGLKDVSPSGNFAEGWALDTRRRLFGPVFSEKPDPVPSDIAVWKGEDARLVLDMLRTGGDSEYLLRHGALKGSFFFPNAEDIVFVGIGHILTRRSALEDRVHWQQICTAKSMSSILWRPPYIAVFSSPTIVTAYRIEDGHPAWMYEFPGYTLQGGHLNRFISLTDGILLLTEPLMGWSESEYSSRSLSQRPAEPKPSEFLWLTKLDADGHKLFQQELTMKSQRHRYAISGGFLVLWAESELICYGPTDEIPRTVPPDEKPPMDEEKRRLEIEKLHAEYDKLAPYCGMLGPVCQKLGWLGDRSMLDIVLADFQKASEQCRPDYTSMLGLLNDRRAIDILIPLLKDEWSVKMKADLALRRLTGVRDIFPQEWEQWWKVHRHLYQED